MFVSQKLTMLASTENAADLEELRGHIEAGRVVPAIDRTYALADTAAAIARVRGGEARGKVVVAILTNPAVRPRRETRRSPKRCR